MSELDRTMNGTPNAHIKALQQAVEEKLAGLDVVLPDLPESELEEDEDKEWLYSSERDYEEQLEVYKERKGRAE